MLFRSEPTPRNLLRHLQEAGADVCMIDSDSLREGRVDFALSWSGSNPLTGGVTVDGRHIAWSEVRSAWLWRPWYGNSRPDHPESQLEPQASQFFRAQWGKFHQGLTLMLSKAGVFCVNPMPQGRATEEKIWQFELARRLGLKVPETLLTTDLSAARDFYDMHRGDIIYKPLAMTLFERPSEPGRERFATVYANRVKREQLLDENRFLPSPCLFQAYVPKQFELRITLIGQHAFAVKIDASASDRARLDWRRYDYENTRYSRFDLPGEIAAKLTALLQELGLVYGAVDMIVTPNGEYVFLEVNPNGQYYWLEQMTAAPLTANLARMLMTARVDYEQKVERDEPVLGT